MSDTQATTEILGGAAARSLPRGAERSERGLVGRPHPVYGTTSGLPTSLAYLAADLVMSLACLTLARVLVNLGWGGVSLGVHAFDFKMAGLTILALIGSLWRAGLYAPTQFRPAWEFSRLGETSALVIGLLAVGLAMAGYAPIAALASLALGGMLLLLVALPLGRALCRMFLSRRGWWGRRVMVLGANPRAAKFCEYLVRNPWCGLRPVGVVDEFEALSLGLDPKFYLGPPQLLPSLARQHGVSLGLLAASPGEDPALSELAIRPGSGIKDWIFAPGLEGLQSLWAAPCEIAGQPALHVENRLESRGSRLLKRAFDVSLILLFSPLLVPLVALITLLVRCTSRGPVFFGHRRPGRGGKQITVWKFRTMHVNAEQILEDYLQLHPDLREEWYRTYKLKRDPRVTLLGRVLRKTSLDELPQLWNVLVGDMSLVGPRPLLLEQMEPYGELAMQIYSQSEPGITGLWQISGRSNSTFDDRMMLDTYYIKNWSIWLDLYILLSTIRVVLKCEGAY